MPLIIPTNSISAGGYEVANSLRFDRDSNDKLTRTLGTPTNQNKFTISFWVKLARFANGRTFFSIYTDSSNETTSDIQNDNTIRFYDYSSTSYTGQYITSRVLRDPSAWYHLVFVYDSGNATAGNRIRIYINGTEETNFSTESNPSLNENSQNTSGAVFNIGDYGGGGYGQSGYMSEFCFIDGQALDPTSFGEFDEDTGIWKPIDVSGLTFGTNGFYLDFENSGSLGADVSGNGNNFTVNNLTSIDQTTDTPTNNYCTLNPLTIPASSGLTLSDGNLSLNASSSDAGAKGTIGVTSGKWYWEIKTNVASGGSDRHLIAKETVTQTTNATGGIWGIQSRAGSGATLNSFTNDTFSNVNTGSTGYNDNTILSVALDMDNGKLYFAKNGTWTDLNGNVGDPVNGTNPTFTSLPTDTIFFPYIENRQTGTPTSQANFGNPPYTISSGNSDANGYGNFEYAVPSGYYALNTKNLAEYG